MIRKIEWTIIVTGVFCLLFSFKIPFLINSTVLVGFISTPYFIFKSIHSKSNVRYKDVYVIISIYFALILYVSLIALLHETYDFTPINAYFSILAAFYSVFLFSSYVKSTAIYNETFDKFYFFSKVIFYVFLIQSFFIIGSILNSDFHQIVQIFQSVDDFERAQKYMGARGLALSGGQFFPLTSIYCLAQIFMAYYFIEKKNLTVIDIVCMVMIMATGLTAGRTAIVGSLVFILIIFGMSPTKKKPYSALMKSIPITILVLYFISQSSYGDSINNYIFDVYLPFAFEFVYSYFDGRGGAIESTEVLSRMYWIPSFYDTLYGYGKYISEDGSTFMSTDGGYMRNLLFGGAIFVVLAVLGTMILYLYLLRRIEPSRHSKIIILSSFTISLILHYKGNVLLNLVGVQTLIFTAIAFTYPICSESK